MKKSFYLILLVLFCGAVGKAWHWSKDGFAISRIRVWQDGSSKPLEQNALQALNQPFYYLSRGHQCYAFVSADDEYVIKIPRTDRYRIPFWLRALPFPTLRAQRERDLAFRESFLLTSFQISFNELKDQTALLAMHLVKTVDEGKSIQIRDRLGKRYVLPLHETAFILQRKKPILMRVFTDALHRGDRKEAKRALDAFLDVVVERARKGILNKDPSFIRNFGFDGEHAFQIDIGSFYRRSDIVGREAYFKSIRETMAPVRDWLAEIDADMLSYIDGQLESFYQRPV